MNRHPHPPNGYEPKEDANFEAYTLGQVSEVSEKAKGNAGTRHNPPTTQQGGDGSNSVSFAQSASSRYLVQRWSDGTPCDKTNKPREVEVQYHCSMTNTDHLYLVKEMSICQYVVVIHTPRLCGLPGFRAPHVDVEPAPIHCRQIIPDDDLEAWINGQFDESYAQRLQLPADAQKADKEQEVKFKFSWDEAQAVEEGSKQTEGSQDGFDLSAELQRLLQTAQEGRIQVVDETPDGESEEVFVVAFDQDEDGNLVWETEGFEGENAVEKMSDDKRDMLLRIVQQYLERKGQETDGKSEGEAESEQDKRSRDEL